ncbi:MAG: DUF378 domain-containing protein, partial [Patescibacteria group bacterium]
QLNKVLEEPIKSNSKKMLHKVAYVLVIVGALNWGLEVLGFGLGNYLPATLMTLVYSLVGLSALYEIFTHKKMCKECSM